MIIEHDISNGEIIFSLEQKDWDTNQAQAFIDDFKMVIPAAFRSFDGSQWTTLDTNETLVRQLREKHFGY
jgi:hypothetical protein